MGATPFCETAAIASSSARGIVRTDSFSGTLSVLHGRRLWLFDWVAFAFLFLFASDFVVTSDILDTSYIAFVPLIAVVFTCAPVIFIGSYFLCTIYFFFIIIILKVSIAKVI